MFGKFVRNSTTVWLYKTLLLIVFLNLLLLAEYSHCTTNNDSFITYNDIPATIREITTSEHVFYPRVLSERICVDNSALIVSYLHYNSSSVFLIRRPRKWGKSMNLEMLKRFLEIELDATTGNPLAEDKRVNKKLFVGGRVQLEDSNKTVDIKSPYVSKIPDIMRLQGTFPVIYLDFEQISGFMDIYDEIEYHLRNKVEDLYLDHHYLQRYLANDSDVLSKEDKRKLDVYMNKDYGAEELKESLRFLSKMLRLHYRRKVHVLIDNFDAPITRLFFNLTEKYHRKQTKDQSDSTIFGKVYESLDFQRTIDLLGEILGRCLQRNNDAVEKSMITGILRLAERGDIFANYTDLRDYTLLDKEFSDFYGFSQDEVDDMLYALSLQKKIDPIREWYAGYQYGGRDNNNNDNDSTLYIPGSLIECLEHDGKLSNYWNHPGRFDVLEYALAARRNGVKEKLRNFLHGKTVEATIGKRLTLDNGISDDDLYGILLFNGYLTADRITHQNADKYACRLSIPNKEITNILAEKLNR